MPSSHRAARSWLGLVTMLGAAMLLAACGGGGGIGYHVTPSRMGALYPSKGEACGIRFENLNFGEASAKYESLGMVSLTGTGSDFTDAMKKDVEREACKMGGDAVSMNASAPGIFQFLVWRAK
jgi:hypothetical protein